MAWPPDFQSVYVQVAWHKTIESKKMEVHNILVVVTPPLILFTILGIDLVLFGRLILWGSLAKEKSNRP